MDIVATVGAITVISYLVGMVCKAIPVFPDNFIPITVGVLGAILGIVGMYTIVDFPAQDILNAIAVGIASGLASTGINQVVKQMKQGEE